jgi:hypothetical protein
MPAGGRRSVGWGSGSRPLERVDHWVMMRAGGGGRRGWVGGRGRGREGSSQHHHVGKSCPPPQTRSIVARGNLDLFPDGGLLLQTSEAST